MANFTPGHAGITMYEEKFRAGPGICSANVQFFVELGWKRVRHPKLFTQSENHSVNDEYFLQGCKPYIKFYITD